MYFTEVYQGAFHVLIKFGCEGRATTERQVTQLLSHRLATLLGITGSSNRLPAL